MRNDTTYNYSLHFRRRQLCQSATATAGWWMGILFTPLVRTGVRVQQVSGWKVVSTSMSGLQEIGRFQTEMILKWCDDGIKVSGMRQKSVCVIEISVWTLCTISVQFSGCLRMLSVFLMVPLTFHLYTMVISKCRDDGHQASPCDEVFVFTFLLHHTFHSFIETAKEERRLI